MTRRRSIAKRAMTGGLTVYVDCVGDVPVSEVKLNAIKVGSINP